MAQNDVVEVATGSACDLGMTPSSSSLESNPSIRECFSWDEEDLNEPNRSYSITSTNSIVCEEVEEEPQIEERFVQLGHCKCQSLTLGAMIGCFIQLSCMGAFFLYSKVVGKSPQQHQLDQTSMWAFSLSWSCFSGMIGFCILVLLSALFRRISRNESFLIHMELYVSTGAVLGMSATWIIKTWCLEDSANGMWQSLASLGLALCYVLFARFIVRSTLDAMEGSTDATLSQPLLPQNGSEDRCANKAADIEDDARNADALHISRVCFALAALVGSLVQMSSLAAHFWIQHTHVTSLTAFCLTWIGGTTLLGLSSFVLVQKLMHHQIQSNNYGAEASLMPLVEASSCVGAFLGVNVCWTITDLLLGMWGKAAITMMCSIIFLWWNPRNLTQMHLQH